MNTTSRTASHEAARNPYLGPSVWPVSGLRSSFVPQKPGWLYRLVLAVVLTSGCVTWAGAAVPAWNTGPRGSGKGEPMTFQCPRAYLGVRQDLLPTHWEILAGRAPLRLKASQVQRGELLCIYQDGRGRSVGTVRRLAPGGYKCISDGVGRFRCRKTR